MKLSEAEKSFKLGNFLIYICISNDICNSIFSSSGDIVIKTFIDYNTQRNSLRAEKHAKRCEANVRQRCLLHFLLSV